MCSSVTEIKREMCRCPLFYVFILKGTCNWNVLGHFFCPLGRYAYSFYRRFLPLFCHYQYTVISLQESSLISVVIVKFDFTLIVANANKCAALSEVLFYFLDLLGILFSRFPLHCRVLLSSLVALPRKTFLICHHLVENQRFDGKRANTQYVVSAYPDSSGLSLSSIISPWYRVFTLT